MTDKPRGTLSLRAKLNLVYGLTSIFVLAVFITFELHSIRASINEEVTAANRVASQLLGRVSAAYARDGLATLTDFLERTGRVRATEVELFDNNGRLLYRSPPSTYKAGREAPTWFAAMVTPNSSPTVIDVTAGKLYLTANPSRAVLDSWDDLMLFIVAQLALTLFALLLVLHLLGRWIAPFERIRQGLLAIEAGEHTVRLPVLPGREPGEMGRAFNRMAQAVSDALLVRQEMAHAQARLAAQREFTQVLQERIEQERSSLARELHDEFGQSLTAIRAIAAALLQHPDIRGGSAEAPLKMLFDTAGGTFDAMHRLIPRLRPLQLDQMGLRYAMRDLASQMEQAHPGLQIAMCLDAKVPALDAERETALYRIFQEALTNVARHAGASRVDVALSATEDEVLLRIADDGCGMANTAPGAPRGNVPGGHGMRGMYERAEMLGGQLRLSPGPLGGLQVEAVLPLKERRT